jgi:hypothetical protein
MTNPLLISEEFLRSLLMYHLEVAFTQLFKFPLDSVFA